MIVHGQRAVRLKHLLFSVQAVQLVLNDEGVILVIEVHLHRRKLPHLLSAMPAGSKRLVLVRVEQLGL